MPRKKSRGLGDTIEKVIKAIGLDNFVNEEDCNCKERKEKLNQLLPYRLKPRCMTKQEYIDWTEFQKNRSLTKLEWKEVVYVWELYNSLFSIKRELPCSGCNVAQELINMIDKIDLIYKTY